MKIEHGELLILDELARDASAQRKEIAYKVRMSEPTLSKKISSLKAEGYIAKFTIEIDYAKIGYPVNAITVFRLEDQAGGVVERVIEKLGSFPQAIEVATMSGEWDIYVRWMCRDNAEPISAVRVVLAAFPGTHAETFTLAEFFKKDRGVHLSPRR